MDGWVTLTGVSGERREKEAHSGWTSKNGRHPPGRLGKHGHVQREGEKGSGSLVLHYLNSQSGWLGGYMMVLIGRLQIERGREERNDDVGTKDTGRRSNVVRRQGRGSSKKPTTLGDDGVVLRRKSAWDL